MQLVLRASRYSFRTGILIATAWEKAAYAMYARGTLPGPLCPGFLLADEDGTVGAGAVALCIVLAYAWGDAHFYWSHRLLHTPLLYRTVHKVHHQSFNPDPLSGLSMHWFESTVYFSAAPLATWFLPLWGFRLLLKGLLIFPLDGHSGHGRWDHETSYNHYIHHAKFNWNYGSSPIWDHLCGTNWDPTTAAGDKERTKQAEVQAQLAGGELGKEDGTKMD